MGLPCPKKIVGIRSFMVPSPNRTESETPRCRGARNKHTPSHVSESATAATSIAGRDALVSEFNVGRKDPRMWIPDLLAHRTGFHYLRTESHSALLRAG